MIMLKDRDWSANTDVTYVANMAEVKGQFFIDTFLSLF